MNIFLLGIAALIGCLTLLYWSSNAKPKDVLRTLKWIAIVAVVGVGALVLITKNAQFLWGLLVLALVWFQRLQWLRNLLRGAKTMRGPSGGQRSEVSSRFFDMRLDHDSGDMDGRIKEGAFEGALLSELSQEEAQQLYRDVAEVGDEPSQRLLEAYMDRRFGASWRDDGTSSGAADEQAAAADGPMTEDEALSLLGLTRGASEEDIKHAHRRLMKQLHPDVGGSAYLAAKVNAAKDFLLNRG